MSFFVMAAKELRELWRSKKIVFVPLVFAILAVGQPAVYKMLPSLLQGASNLPPGAVIEIPVPSPGQVMGGVVGQLNQVAVLLLVLVAMCSIAGERASGVTATVLTKPVSRGGYLGAKALAFSALAVVSLGLAALLGGYYTGVLIGPVDWAAVLRGGLLYLPNLLLAVAVTLLFSAVLRGQVAAGGAALVTLIMLNTVPGLFGRLGREAFPGALTARATAAMAGAPLPAGALPHVVPLAVTLGLAALFLVVGWQVLKRQEI